MKLSQVKSAVKQTIRENFKQSLSEVSYDFGKKQYTDKNMTPVEILDLAILKVSMSSGLYSSLNVSSRSKLNASFIPSKYVLW